MYVLCGYVCSMERRGFCIMNTSNDFINITIVNLLRKINYNLNLCNSRCSNMNIMLVALQIYIYKHLKHELLVIKLEGIERMHCNWNELKWNHYCCYSITYKFNYDCSTSINRASIQPQFIFILLRNFRIQCCIVYQILVLRNSSDLSLIASFIVYSVKFALKLL